MDKFFKGKGLKYGTMTLALVAIALIAVLLINFIAVVITERLGLRFDITDNRIYQISDTTVNMLKNLEEDVTVTVLATEEQYMNNSTYLPIREVLIRYEQLSNGRLTVRYIDPYLNTDIVNSYSELEKPSARDIIVETSKRFRKLVPTDLYAARANYNSGNYDEGLIAEQKFSSAIMYCIADELPKVYRLMGHDEGDLLQLNSLLSTANYTLNTLNIAVNEVPDDATFLIINNPMKDFTLLEIERLDAYFERGGNAIIFYDVTCPTLPVFERFMEEWGVRYTDLFVCDDKWAYASPRTIIPGITSHTMTTGVAATDEFLIADMSRAITILYDIKGYRTVSPILTSTSSSYGKIPLSDGTVSDYTRAPGDTSGPFYVALLSEDTNPNTKINSKILFMTTGIAMDAALSQNNFLNQKFMVSTLNYMNETADSVIIEARYFNTSALNITAAQASAVFWCMCVILPAAILISGIVIWVRRRNM